MDTPHVFLDTEVFEANNFQFDSRALEKLASLAREGTIVIHLTEVTRREIQEHVVSYVNKAVSLLRKVSKDRAVQHFALLPDSPFRAIGRDFDPEPFIRAALTAFDDFLRDTAVDVIPVSDVSVDQVFSQYFGSVPPFQTGAKKAEFPDAFALGALRQWCERTTNSIYVISRDTDFCLGCQESPALISLASLDEFLDLAAREPGDLYTLANRVFEEFKAEILEELKDEFQGLFFFLDEADSDVSDVEVTNIEADKELAISVEENEAFFELTADVTFTANYSYADFIVEDVIVSRDEGTIERTVPVHAEVSVLYDRQDPAASQVHFVTIREKSFQIDLQPDPYELK